MKLNDKKKWGLILVLIASFGYGTLPIVTQLGYQAGMSAETVLAFRFMVAVLLIWIYVFYKKLPYSLPLRNIVFLLFLGALMVGASTLAFESYKYVPGAIASLLINLYVVLVVIIEIVIGREKLNINMLGCVLLASIGVFAIVSVPEETGSLRVLGIIFACLAAFCYSFYTIGIGEKNTRKTMPEIVTAYTLIPPCLFNIVRCFFGGQPFLPLGFDQWVIALYIGIVSTFIAGICFIIAVKHIGSGNAALINTSEPMIAYITGIVLMGDVLSLRSTLGGVLIITAIIWLNLMNRSPKT